MADPWYEIIAIRIGSKIYFGQAAINVVRQNKDYDQIISRAEFQMMSRLDLGDKWGQYAEHAPTLLVLEKGTNINVRNPNPYMHGCTQ